MFGRGIGKESGRRVGLPKELLESGLRRRRSLCDKCQLEVVDDPVHYGIVCKESDDAHPAATSGAGQRVDFENLADNLGPAAVGDIQQELLPHPLTPFLPPLGMAGWAKSSGAA